MKPTPLRQPQDTEVSPVVPSQPEETPAEPPPKKTDLDAVAELADAHRQILAEIEKRIIGQRRVIDQLLVALFARGHTLFVGVPGLAKTLLISTLAETLNLSFQRIQFTPDLMPADITGTEVL
jgi:MoxR-like ATPase